MAGKRDKEESGRLREGETARIRKSQRDDLFIEIRGMFYAAERCRS